MKYLRLGIFLFATAIVAQEEFVPGDSEIKESNILASMERELGHEFTPKPVATRENLSRPESPKPSPAVGTGAKLTMSGGTEAQGFLVLPENFVSVLSENEGSVESKFKIPVLQINILEFADWKPGRITSLPENREQVLLFPTTCRIEKTDGSKISGRIDPLEWLQLNMATADSLSSYHSYFKLERPISQNQPEAFEPPKGTVTRIYFIHDKGEKSNAALP